MALQQGPRHRIPVTIERRNRRTYHDLLGLFEAKLKRILEGVDDHTHALRRERKAVIGMILLFCFAFSMRELKKESER